MRTTRSLSALLLAAALAACGNGGSAPASDAGTDGPSRPGGPSDDPAASCAPDDDGLALADGFCAVVVHDGVGPARHVTVTPGGDLFVALREAEGGGGVVALRDTTGDGRADVEERFGDTGGSGVLWRDGRLFFAPDDRVLRWRLPAGSLAPAEGPETVVAGLPTGGHGAKSLALMGADTLLVNVGSASNACQEEHRTAGSPGQDPCPELARRAGVWRFDAGGTDQAPEDGARWATGLRNAYALAVHPSTGRPHAVVHGRDQLHSLWPDLYGEQASAEAPAEEFVAVDEGDDFGWPYCYHDPQTDTKVLAPEYGGDGRRVGRCAEAAEPLLAFPAHWAPNDLTFRVDASAVGPSGAFIAFHGSWNRAPLPQEGYKVVFAPFEAGAPTGEWQVFADGFAGGTMTPRGARYRPTGLAVTPEGHLIVVDGQEGRIWRIVPESGD